MHLKHEACCTFVYTFAVYLYHLQWLQFIFDMYLAISCLSVIVLNTRSTSLHQRGHPQNLKPHTQEL